MLAIHNSPPLRDDFAGQSSGHHALPDHSPLLSAPRTLNIENSSGEEQQQHEHEQHQRQRHYAQHSLESLHEAGSSSAAVNLDEGTSYPPHFGHSSVASSSDAASPDSLFTTSTDDIGPGSHWSFDEQLGEHETRPNFKDLAMDFAQSAASAWTKGGEMQAMPMDQQQYEHVMFQGGMMGGSSAVEKPLLTAEDITTAQLREMAPFLRVPAAQEQYEYEQSAVAAAPGSVSGYPSDHSQYASSFGSDTPSVSGYSTMSAAESAYSHGPLSRETSFTNVQQAMPGQSSFPMQAYPLERQISAQSGRASTSVEGRQKPTKSHSRRRPEGHIKRPLNAFFLFRKHVSDYNLIPKHFVVNDQRAVSRIIACMWQNLPSTWQDEWRKQYHREREAFHAAHPDYKYKPDTNAAAKKAKRTLQSEHLQQEECKEIADQIFMSFQAPKVNEPVSKKPAVSKAGTSRTAAASDAKTPRRKRGSKPSVKESLQVGASAPLEGSVDGGEGKVTRKASRAKRGAGKRASQKEKVKAPDSASTAESFHFREPITVPSQPDGSSQAAFAQESHVNTSALGMGFDLPSTIPDSLAHGNSLLIHDWGQGLGVEARSAAQNNLSPALSQGSLPAARSFGSQPLSFSSPIQSSTFDTFSPAAASSTPLRRKKLPPPHLQLVQRQTASSMPRPSPRTMSFSGLPSASRPFFGARADFGAAAMPARIDTEMDLDRQRPHTMATPREAAFKIWPKSNLNSTLLSPSKMSLGELHRAGVMPGSALFGSFSRISGEPQTAKDADISTMHVMAQDLATGSGWTPLRAHFGLESSSLGGAFPRARRMSFDVHRRESGPLDSGLESALAFSPRTVAAELLEPLTARPGANFFAQQSSDASASIGGSMSASALPPSFQQLVSPTSATLSLHGSVPDFDFSVSTPRTARPSQASLSMPAGEHANGEQQSLFGLVATDRQSRSSLGHSDADMDTSASSDATLRALTEALSAPAGSGIDALSHAQSQQQLHSQSRRPRQRDDSYDVFHFSADFLETAQHDTPAGSSSSSGGGYNNSGGGASGAGGRLIRASSLPPAS